MFTALAGSNVEAMFEISRRPATVYWTLPVFVLPDFEPLDKVLSALESGVQAVLLTFETGHILHGDAVNTWEKLRMRGEDG